MPLLNIGKLVMTVGIKDAADGSKTYSNELVSCVERYISYDWGDLCEDDKVSNQEALRNGNRILGAYNTSKGKVYIITECDRSVTTVLFASEY